jgi:CBS-domain-containing membrane protein
MLNFLLKSLTENDLPIPGAEPWHARPEDPALTVMTDFRERSSVTTADSVTIDAALEHMKHAGVRCAFATNDLRRVVGLITAYDIMSEKPMRYLRAVPGQRHDVLVRDIMVRIADWRIADVKDLERSTVAVVSRHFDDTRLTHIPVMEMTKDGRRQLRGLLSAAKVRRLLASQG